MGDEIKSFVFSLITHYSSLITFFYVSPIAHASPFATTSDDAHGSVRGVAE
jgi:hypothetical protein